MECPSTRKEVMDFPPRGQIPRGAGKSESIATRENGFNNQWIARPVALKSKGHSDPRSTDSEESELQGESWSVVERRLSKKLRASWRPELADSPASHSGKLLSNWESHETRTTNPGCSSTQQPTGLGFLSSKMQTNTSCLRPSGPQVSHGGVGYSDLLGAPSLRQTCPTQAHASGKRSAFREVKKHQQIGCHEQQPCADTARLRSRRREQQKERPINASSEHLSESTFQGPSPLTQTFYGSAQTLLATHSNNLHANHLGRRTEREEEFVAPSFIPLKRRPPPDFLNHTQGCDALKTVKNTNPYKNAFSVQFGPFQNGANAEGFSRVPFAWQQPLVPTSVLPLSSSVHSRQYDNWCAKCSASFRMTSDLVYHMRTQHKRSSDGNGGGSNSASTSTEAGDRNEGKRVEEKLKCNLCGESFRERHHLTRHMTSHNAERE